MTEIPETALTVDLAALRRDIEETEKRLEQLQAFEQMARRYALSNGKPQPPPQPLLGFDLSEHDVAGKTVREAAEILLRKYGKPMRVVEMIEVFDAVGYGQKLANIKNALFTAMDRDKDVFEKIDRGVWGLNEWKKKEPE